MKRITREWVQKAENDYKAAGKLARGPEPLHDAVCFHCQQSAEKYLKALLEELGLTVPHTHNLDSVLSLLLTHYPSLRSFRRGLIFLTNFAVGTRYPSRNARRRQSVAARRWAGRVRDACRVLLGFRPPRRRKSS